MITIDNFATPNPGSVWVVPPGNNTAIEISQLSGGAIGGQRDALFSLVGTTANPFAAVGILGYDTVLTINALQVGTNGLVPTLATLQYSGLNSLSNSTSLGNAHGLGGGLGVDLTGGGSNDRFLLHFFSSDAQPTTGLDLKITITSPGGKSSIATATVPNALNAPFNVFVPFSHLVGNASTSHVDSISFVFNGANKTPNVDFEVQLLAVVPEPGAGLLMALATGGLTIACAARRCRRLAK